MMRRRLSVRSPIREIAPSFCLPPIARRPCSGETLGMCNRARQSHEPQTIHTLRRELDGAASDRQPLQPERAGIYPAEPPNRIRPLTKASG
jgi:hypothetical protein